MRDRLLPVCLLSAGLLIAAAIYPAVAKPPQLPVQERIDCEEECQEAPAVQGHQTLPPCPVCPASAGKSTEKTKLITKIYPVAGLVIPIGHTGPSDLPAEASECCHEKKATKSAAVAKDSAKKCTSCCPACASAGCCPAAATIPVKTATTQARQVTEEKQLIRLIEQTIQPNTWQAKGGAGSVEYFPITMSLAIRQTAAIHSEIAEMLATLRREQDTQVAVEVRFISVSEEFMDRLGMKCSGGEKKCHENEDCCEGKKSCTNGLSVHCEDVQTVKFLGVTDAERMMEALQADAKTNVMQAPKVTMLNGQESRIQVCDEQCYVTGMMVKHIDGKVVFIPQNETFKTGTDVALQPVVSADHRFVRVKVNARLTSLDSSEVSQIRVTSFLRQTNSEKKETACPVMQFIQDPKFIKLSVDKTLSLPDGGTALITVGQRPCEKAEETPVLSKVPYINQLFNKDCCKKEKTTEVVLMMVTPRIIVSEQEEIAFHKDITSCPKEKLVKDAMPLADIEEQEAAPSPKQSCGEVSLTSARTGTGKAAKLVKQYRRACAEGDSAKATELAIKALAIDPLCFGKK